MSVKLLHTSDVHLEWLFEGFPEEARRRRRAEVAAALARLVDVAIEHRVGALVVSGDLFHGDAPSLHARAEVTSLFERLDRAGIPVLLIPGNHDQLTPRSFYRLPRFPANVRLFCTDTWSACDLPCGVRVYGLPYRQQDAGRRVLEGFAAHREQLDRELADCGDGPRVAMVHGSFRGLPLGPEDYCPIHPQDIAASGLDYLALGHYHDFRDCSQGRTAACYPGAPARLTFACLAPRRAALVELGEGPARVTPLELEDREYRVLEWDLGRSGLERLYDRLSREADPEVALRLELRGWPAEPADAAGEGEVAAASEGGAPACKCMGGAAAPADGAAWRAPQPLSDVTASPAFTVPSGTAPLSFNPRELADRFGGSFFHLEVVDHTAPVVPVSAGDLTVRGLFIARIQERLASARDPEEAGRLRRALVLGLEALAGRRPG